MFVNCSTCTDSVLGRDMSPFYLDLMLFFFFFCKVHEPKLKVDLTKYLENHKFW